MTDRQDRVDYRVVGGRVSAVGCPTFVSRRNRRLYSPPLSPLPLKRPHLHPNYGEDW